MHLATLLEAMLAAKSNQTVGGSFGSPMVRTFKNKNATLASIFHFVC